MARLLAQTLTLARLAPATATATATSASLLPLRGLATKVEIIEIDLADDDASAPAADDASAPADDDRGSLSVEVVGIRRLEEAFHGVIVRRATPDWLPFVPGGSFWVPPVRLPHGVAELVGRFAAAGPEVVGDTGRLAYEAEADAPMTEEEEALSFSTVRGWPSAAYFVEGKSPYSKKRPRKGAIQTDDEES